MYKRILVLSALALTAVPALAQSDAPPAPEPEVETRYNKRTVITVGETAVVGDIEKPTGTRILANPTVRFAPRLPLRASFRRELLSSSGNL